MSDFQKDLATGEHRVRVEDALARLLANQVLILECVVGRDSWNDDHKTAITDSITLYTKLLGEEGL